MVAQSDRTGGAVCNVSYWHVGVQDGFVGPQNSAQPNSHDCTLVLILQLGWLHTHSSLSMSGFRDKQRTLVNTVGVPGDADSSPGKSRGGMPKYDPTT